MTSHPLSESQANPMRHPHNLRMLPQLSREIDNRALLIQSGELSSNSFNFLCRLLMESLPFLTIGLND